MVYGTPNSTFRNRGATTRSSGFTSTTAPQRAETFHEYTAQNHSSERTDGTQTDRRTVGRTASVGRGNERGKSSGVSLPPPVLLPAPPPPQPPPSPPPENLLEHQTEELHELKQGAILRPRIPDSPGADQANVPKPRHMTDKSILVHVSDPEIAELRDKLNEREETLQRWRAKCGQLATDKRELQEQKSKWKESSDRYRRELDAEKDLAATRLVKHQHELEVQYGKFERLNAAHIKSINSVGTGLDPISDQEFTTKLRDLQDQVLLHLHLLTSKSQCLHITGRPMVTENLQT